MPGDCRGNGEAMQETGYSWRCCFSQAFTRVPVTDSPGRIIGRTQAWWYIMSGSPPGVWGPGPGLSVTCPPRRWLAA
jgi:hypothetical protein